MASSLTEGEILAGKYRVERTLGTGSMGVVYAAWHTELEQRVAIKLIHPQAVSGKDAQERFRREARAAAKIRSEHTARVIDIGMHGEAPFMVMEFLEGHDLAEELSARGALPVDEAASYLLQAIEALAEAHVAGIVHRDLKPANLFLAVRADGSRSLKVLDFGISKLTTESQPDLGLTSTSSLIGSPLYMSPEQMRSPRDIDARADIWSLGVVLHELLTQDLPYNADSLADLYAALLRDPPPRLTELRPGSPPSLEAVILRCLERDRDRRFQHVGELAASLVEFAPSSATHAERAMRVISAGRPVSSPFTARPSKSDPSATASPLAAQRTIAGWDTGQGSFQRKLRPRGFIAALVGLLGLGGLAAWNQLAKRVPSPEPEAASNSVPAASGLEQPDRSPPGEPRPSPEPSATTTVVSVRPATSVSASKPARAPARPAAKPRPQHATTPPPASTPKQSAAHGAPAAPSAAGLPEFGGRR